MGRSKVDLTSLKELTVTFAGVVANRAQCLCLHKLWQLSLWNLTTSVLPLSTKSSRSGRRRKLPVSPGASLVPSAHQPPPCGLQCIVCTAVGQVIVFVTVVIWDSAVYGRTSSRKLRRVGLRYRHCALRGHLKCTISIECSAYRINRGRLPVAFILHMLDGHYFVNNIERFLNCIKSLEYNSPL